MEAALYLLPALLGETSPERVLPAYNREVIAGIRHFIVEDVRSARRFLKRVVPAMDIDSLTFYVLGKHTAAEEIPGFLRPLAAGEPMGVISEAGCPGVADPGQAVVEMAGRQGWRVVPLVGPSSIILSLMASGFNGQCFAFNGYLPIDAAARVKALRTLEQRIYALDQTQLFIETPYRNNKLVETILATCRPQTRLCIASGITCEGEFIRTLSVKEWRGRVPDLSKVPTIFLLYK